MGPSDIPMEPRGIRRKFGLDITTSGRKVQSYLQYPGRFSATFNFIRKVQSYVQLYQEGSVLRSTLSGRFSPMFNFIRKVQSYVQPYQEGSVLRSTLSGRFSPTFNLIRKVESYIQPYQEGSVLRSTLSGRFSPTFNLIRKDLPTRDWRETIDQRREDSRSAIWTKVLVGLVGTLKGING
ncbi:hypothetical protein LR48_Vigan09g136800 [Vigna angularis]|uniref:Uncharacterized protein n=1 Tax=Phaseolus angularis TaxID=3914 RepID=A0A0L9VDF8_PHAAN|nr:hypothetical protein LR48_Vigan09g136800 [Vigna angularis]